MANEIFKEIKTKIALKTLSYTEWDAIKDTYKPLKGEVCVCAIPEGNAAATTAPTVMFKVGDGTNFFGALKWASALAADVYGWAKENALFIHKDGTGNVVSGVEWDASLNGGKGGVKYTTAAVATAEGLEDLQEKVDTLEKEVYGEDGSAENSRIDKLEKDIADNRDAWNKYEDTRYSFSTDGDKLVVKKTLYTNGVAGAEEPVGTYEFLTADEVGEILKNYYTKSEADAKFVTGLAEGATNGTIKAVVNGVSGADVKVHGLQDAAYTTVDALNATAKDYADAALADAKKYADEKPHENTAHTHSAGAGLVKTGDGGISGNVEYSANINVKYENSWIYLVDKTSGEKIGDGFNASEFVKDSYLQNVNYDDVNNVLTFTFIDNEDKLQAIPVDLNDLVDVYTADEISLTKTGAEFSIKDGGVSTAKIANDAVDADKLADAINEDIAKGVAAKTVTDTLKGLAFQDKIDNSDIDDNSIAAGKIANFTAEVAAVKVNDADKLDDHDATYFATKEEHDALDARTEGYNVSYPNNTNENFISVYGYDTTIGSYDTTTISSGGYVQIQGPQQVKIESEGAIDLIGNTTVTGSLKVGKNSVVTEDQLSTIATSGSIYDVTEASETDDGIKYILLDCNW